MEKTCLVCSRSLHLENFSDNPATLDGLSHECEQCASGIAALKLARAKDVRRAIDKRFRNKRKAASSLEDMLK